MTSKELNYTIKCKLDSILKYPSWKKLIQLRVEALNKIWVESNFLFNLHVLDYLKEDKRPTGRIKEKKKKKKNGEEITKSKQIYFDCRTLERCALFVTQRYNSVRDYDQEFYELQNTYENIYLKLGVPDLSKQSDNNLKLDFADISAVSNPVNYLSRQMMVNIENHVKLNFNRFQKIYLKSIVFTTFSKLKIKRKIMYSILGMIQYYVNHTDNSVKINSKLLLNFDRLNEILPLIKKIILNERTKIPLSIQNNTTFVNLKTNCWDVLRYYYLMVDYLEQHKQKRFSVLPQLNMGYNYIKFDSRFLSTIYDEWVINLQNEVIAFGEKYVINKYNINYKLKSNHKKHFKYIYKRYFGRRIEFGDRFNFTPVNKNYDEELIKELPIEILFHGLNYIRDKYGVNFPLKTVGIKSFEKNYKDFYKICFNFEKFRTCDNPISFQTNGYSVCVLFQQVKNELVNSSENIILDYHFRDKKIKRGLFDADNCLASQNFLNNFNLTSIDPNNDILLYCYDQSGNKIKITKGYYNEISHIKRNTNKMKKHVNKYGMSKIYDRLSTIGHKKSVDIERYKIMILIYRSFWNRIWNFYSKNEIMKLELDTYINKKKATHKIARRIAPKKSKKRRYSKYKNKFKSNISNNKQQLIFFGKGNGNTTISNLRNSGPKGPVKSIAIELSKLCVVILTDEFRTSQICSSCKTEKVEHPLLPKTRFKKLTDSDTGKVSKIKVTELRESHKLCYCKHKTHLSTTGSHKTWNRDYNASRNIMHVGQCKLLNKDLGIFSRSKADKVKHICLPLGEQESKNDIRKKLSPPGKMGKTKTCLKKEKQKIEEQTITTDKKTQKINYPKKFIQMMKRKNIHIVD